MGSVKGSVTIHAQNNITVRASDIIAGKDTLITGRNVDIESKDNTYRGKEEHEYKKSGLTVSLGGTAVNAARDIAAPVRRAGEVGDGRLKALYALQAGMNARDIQKNQKTDKAINKNNAVGINISLGSTGWKDHAETITEETKGSRITAGRTAAVIAKEDMTVKGSTVNAQDIHLTAGNNIHILSSENKSTTIEDYKAKSGSIGASISKGGYGIGASYGKGKGQTEETTLTHTPSDITAKDTVSLSSGNDTLIRGGTVKGNKVTANAGRMSIESEQDKKNYKETEQDIGPIHQLHTGKRRHRKRRKRKDEYRLHLRKRYKTGRHLCRKRRIRHPSQKQHPPQRSNYRQQSTGRKEPNSPPVL